MRGRINIKRYFQVLGISLAVVFVGLLAFLFLSDNNIDSNLTPEEIATVSAEELDGKINVLLLGLDEGGQRTDTIIVASYDTKEKKARLLSIPRDTKMYLGGKDQKINAAHALKASHGGHIGAQGTVEAVTRLTGIPINFYVELPFSAVEECINVVGPVEFEIPDLGGDGVGMVYDDPAQDLHINLKPGLQELNGEQVVHLLRYRKGNLINGTRRTYKNGDIERIAVQQEFMKALIDQKLNAQLISDIPSLFSEISKSLKTNLAFRDVARYAPSLTGFNVNDEESFKMWTLPGAAEDVNEVSYFVCDLEETRKLVEEEFGFDASDITDGKRDSFGDYDEPENEKPVQKTNTKPKATATPDTAATPKATIEVEGTKKPSSTMSASSNKETNSDKTKASAKPTAKASATPKATSKPGTKPTPVATKKPADKQTSDSKTESSSSQNESSGGTKPSTDKTTPIKTDSETDSDEPKSPVTPTKTDSDGEE